MKGRHAVRFFGKPLPEAERLHVQELARNFRLWASLPAHIGVLLLHDDSGQGVPIAEVRRPTFPRGVCTHCGCSEFDPCVVDDGMGPEGCAWVTRAHNACSACVGRRRGRR